MNSLRTRNIADNFTVPIKNRFDVLQNSDEEIDWWSEYAQAMKTGKQNIPTRKKRNEEWMSEETRALIEDRNKLHRKGLNQELFHDTVYRSKARGIKRSVRRDKRRWIDTIAVKPEAANARGDSRTLYPLTRQL